MSRPTPTNPHPIDFGPNVIIFDPSMPMNTIQSKASAIFQQQDLNQFGSQRYALFFKPGQYNLDIEVGYYTTVHGLGHLPDDVTITGGVQSQATSKKGVALDNFWRGAENFAVIPKDANINTWAVSQATYLRRVHVKGELWFFNHMFQDAYASGGFMADSVVDVQIISGSQQQFLTRNCNLGKWIGGVWNMVFVGDEAAPPVSWPATPNTVVEKTPVIREKPYLVIDSSGNYAVQVPGLKKDSQGTSWAGMQVPVTALPINQFYIANSNTDTVESLNAALQQGFHLIFTPGVYHLDGSLQVNYPNTVVLGLGMATLTPDQGTPAMIIADVPGVTVCGIIFDAGLQPSSSLLIAGPSPSIRSAEHSANPSAFFDLCGRVGGAIAGKTTNCFTINSNNVIMENVWLWRADHGNPGTVGWDINTSMNGLTVNGQNVIVYGLFVEHFEGFQTIWNGNGGQVFFYQSEIPYDVPSQSAWQQPHTTEKGYPSYKVSDQVTTHAAQGMGVYSFFNNNVQLDNAIETPMGPGIQMQHIITVWLPSPAAESSINHIINGMGPRVFDAGTTPKQVMKAQSAD